MEKLDNSKYMVCVSCMSFNHSGFIETAMNGFCMQQTNFPFVCTIMDDASMDGEQEIIDSFLQKFFNIEDKSLVISEVTSDYIMTFAQHKTNKNCFFAVYKLKYNHYSINKSKIPYLSRWRKQSRYIAICEGDDYWIDSLKLLKQVDFLESNYDYSMCFHRARLLNNGAQGVGLQCDDIENREYKPNELLASWKVPTASTLFRREVLEIVNLSNNRILNSDICLVMNCAKMGKIRGMSDVMSVYRIHGGGVTYDERFQKERLLKYPDHFKFIKENYPFLNQGLVNLLIMCSYYNRRTIQNSFCGYLKDTLLAVYYRLSAAYYNKLINKKKLLS